MPFSQAERDAERAKYARAYALPKYHMSAARRVDTIAKLAELPRRGSYLDVGCGRREMLDAAYQLGFRPVNGTEIVPALIDGKLVVEAWLQSLPFADKSFNVVSCFDVLEHLGADDLDVALRELGRVARKHVLISTNLNSSQPIKGEELHRTRQSYEAWNALITAAFQRDRVVWDNSVRRKGGNFWRIDLC